MWLSLSRLHSSRVMFFSRKTIAIRDIIIHPDYMENSLYNNIAILKLESEAPFIHAQLEPYYFKDHNVFLNCRKNVEYNDFSCKQMLLVSKFTNNL